MTVFYCEVYNMPRTPYNSQFLCIENRFNGPGGKSIPPVLPSGPADLSRPFSSLPAGFSTPSPVPHASHKSRKPRKSHKPQPTHTVVKYVVSLLRTIHVPYRKLSLCPVLITCLHLECKGPPPICPAFLLQAFAAPTPSSSPLFLLLPHDPTHL